MALGGLVVAAVACAGPRPAPGAVAQAVPGAGVARRPFRAWDGARWLGRGICYGPHRDGQRPGGPGPSRDQLREDLRLLAGRFEVLRVYGADGPTPELLDLVAAERLPFRVLLGAWIEPEGGPLPSEAGAGPAPVAAPAPPPGGAAAARARNRAQVEGAARLAEAFPDLVLAVVVGNETQVSWSAHRLPPEVLIGWLREARRLTRVPVATADDFGFWVRPESEAVAREVDLLVTHAHPLWNGRRLEEALAFTREQVAAVAARHPGVPLLLGETGWATRKAPVGEQATLIRGTPGEAEQAAFLQAFTAWADAERLPYAWFEAFDEGWKGGSHPDEVEKHWGLWRADRTPKAAAQSARW